MYDNNTRQDNNKRYNITVDTINTKKKKVIMVTMLL